MNLLIQVLQLVSGNALSVLRQLCLKIRILEGLAARIYPLFNLNDLLDGIQHVSLEIGWTIDGSTIPWTIGAERSSVMNLMSHVPKDYVKRDV